MRAEDGKDRIVAIDIVSSDHIMLHARVFERGTVLKPPTELPFGDYFELTEVTAVYAARVDPGNDAHCTIDLDTGGKRFSLDAWLKANEFLLEPREGLTSPPPSSPASSP
jgi:hypothetical protein